MSPLRETLGSICTIMAFIATYNALGINPRVAPLFLAIALISMLVNKYVKNHSKSTEDHREK